MKHSPIPANEVERVRLLHDLDIIGTIEPKELSDITALAASVCNSPISLLTCVDRDKHVFIAQHGANVPDIERDLGICSTCIMKSQILYLPDLDKEPKFSKFPIVNENSGIKFYVGYPLEIKKGLRVGVLCVLDYKPKRLTQEQLKLFEGLGRQMVSQLKLRLKNKELSEMREREREFQSLVSHELRTPLTSIYGSLSFLNSGTIEPESEKGRLLIDVCVRNAENLKHLIDDFLDNAKIDADKIVLYPKLDSINNLIKLVADQLQGYLKIYSVSLELILEENLPLINFDQKRMQQVLNNLITNAVKHSEKGSKIIIKSTVSDTNVEVSVKDFGSGIPKRLQGQIFQKFSCLDQEENKTPGSGLGLMVAKKFIELHEGKIFFISKEGVGSVFTFSLPISQVPAVH